jgi:hypothetical protein
VVIAAFQICDELLDLVHLLDFLSVMSAFNLEVHFARVKRKLFSTASRYESTKSGQLRATDGADYRLATGLTHLAARRRVQT